MVLVKILVIAGLFIGLLGTFIHKIPGTPLIFLSAFIYGALTDFITMDFAWTGLLLGLTLLAELGSSFLRDHLLPRAGIDKAFGLDVAAGSFTTLVMAEVLAGPLIGLIIWEMIIGKSLMPMLKRSGILVVTLFAAALFRFTIAMAMVSIVIFKIL
jgi:uncharacterized protein YqgC (DUF456 family)